MELAGKRVFVTGAGKGIGREIALELAGRGCVLVLSDRDEVSLQETAVDCKAIGVDVESLVIDVTDIDVVAGLHEGIGVIDVLINNAGTVHGGGFLDISMDDHRHTSRVNFEGLMAVTHALLPGMLKQPSATIVNIASAASFVGLPFGTSYAATKWAVLGFGESLRLELKELGYKGVHVIHVCPSYVKGALFQGARPVGPTRLLLPEMVARRIVIAIERDHNWVRIPWGVAISRLLMAALPRKFADLALRLTGATKSMTGWQGRGHSSD
jgi:all-trans-retinol dehydrogenase (NAD+)